VQSLFSIVSSLKRMVSRWAFWLVLQHSLNPSVTLLNWVKANNTQPIHRLCTQTFSTPQKQTYFWESNLWHLCLARVPVKMLTHYTNPPPWLGKQRPWALVWFHGRLWIEVRVLSNTRISDTAVCFFYVAHISFNHGRFKLDLHPLNGVCVP